MKAWEYWLAFPVLCCCHSVLWYCTDLWPSGGLSPSSLDWLHQINATSDSVHARILFYFFNFWGIIAISPSFPCSSDSDGWSLGDRTAHWRFSWAGCCKPPCLGAHKLSTRSRGHGVNWGSAAHVPRGAGCLLFPWEHPACFSWKIKSNVSNTL